MALCFRICLGSPTPTLSPPEDPLKKGERDKPEFNASRRVGLLAPRWRW